jgi:L-amino acid N-acyltransferase YncA
VIRPAVPADAAAIQAIYAHHVAHGTGTFEEVAPSVEDMAARMAGVIDKGCPYLVDETDGRIRGFAYAGPFRLRSAYRYTVEDSVYVAPDCMGQGIGRNLLTAIVEQCRQMGVREILAVIGDSANGGSVGVHLTCGFYHVGVARNVGFKHGRFLDVVFMQLSMNQAGDPEWEGLPL